MMEFIGFILSLGAGAAVAYVIYKMFTKKETVEEALRDTQNDFTAAAISSGAVGAATGAAVAAVAAVKAEEKVVVTEISAETQKLSDIVKTKTETVVAEVKEEVKKVRKPRTPKAKTNG
jgi:hypothetical protein